MRKCEGAACRSAESEGAGRDVRRCGAARYTSGQMLEAALENCHFMALLPRLGVIPTCLKPNGKPFPATQIGHETLALRLLRYPVARSGTETAMSGTPAVHYVESRSPSLREISCRPESGSRYGGPARPHRRGWPRQV
jgi:hypothetical protein